MPPGRLDRRWDNLCYCCVMHVLPGRRMDYLVWYRTVLAIPVQNGTRVQLIEPLAPGSAAGGFRVSVQRTGGASEALYARKVVLATGIQGGGEW